MIAYEDFAKIELKIATVLSAERVEGSEKLLKLQIDLGSEKRQLIAGIGKLYEPEQLMAKQIVVVANLQPRMFMLGSPEQRAGGGFESNGMLLAAEIGRASCRERVYVLV